MGWLLRKSQTTLISKSRSKLSLNCVATWPRFLSLLEKMPFLINDAYILPSNLGDCGPRTNHLIVEIKIRTVGSHWRDIVIALNSLFQNVELLCFPESGVRLIHEFCFLASASEKICF